MRRRPEITSARVSFCMHRGIGQSSTQVLRPVWKSSRSSSSGATSAAHHLRTHLLATTQPALGFSDNCDELADAGQRGRGRRCRHALRPPIASSENSAN